MASVIIENPVPNSPYDEPWRHFRFTDEGITGEIVAERRISTYFVPIARPRKKPPQMALDNLWTADRIQENELISRIRSRVALWRQGGHQRVTKTTARVLAYRRHKHVPGVISRLRDGGPDSRFLTIAVTGEKKRDKEAKVANARDLWVPAVNGHGGYGRWAFAEIDGPSNALARLRAVL